MELTGKLKEQVENAKTKEEAIAAFKEAGIVISDDELDSVSGGMAYYTSDPRRGRGPINPHNF